MTDETPRCDGSDDTATRPAYEPTTRVGRYVYSHPMEFLLTGVLLIVGLAIATACHVYGAGPMAAAAALTFGSIAGYFKTQEEAAEAAKR